MNPGLIADLERGLYFKEALALDSAGRELSLPLLDPDSKALTRIDVPRYIEHRQCENCP
jgi:hypothetical protein